MNFESTTHLGNKSRHGGTLTINNGEAKYDIGIYVTYKGQLRITGKLEQLLYSENVGTGECVKPTNLSVSSAGCTASIRFNKIELIITAQTDSILVKTIDYHIEDSESSVAAIILLKDMCHTLSPQK
jgi:hypothetical protein